MAVSITVPNGTALVKTISGTNYICARGSGASGAAWIYATVYQGTPASIPEKPPPLCRAIVPDGGGNWEFSGGEFDLLPGAACSPSAPFPTNTLAVWEDRGGKCFEVVVSTSFDGQCSEDTDCESPQALRAIIT